MEPKKVSKSEPGKAVKMKHVGEGIYTRKLEKLFKGKPDIAYYVTYKNDGKKVFEKIGTFSKGYSLVTAREIRAERIRESKHGELAPKKRKKIPLFADIADQYIEWAQENKKSHDADKSRIDTHLKPAFKGKKLNNISTFDLERLKSDLKKEGLSNATIKHCLVLIRQIFNRALYSGSYKGPNPIKGVKLPTLQNQRERFLSFDEAQALLTVLKEKSKTVYDMAVISLHCGLRFGEIADLKSQDIDLNNGIITILNPKNKEARKAYMTNQVKEILEHRTSKEPEEYLFKDKLHKGRIAHVSRTFFEVVKTLGLNDGVKDPRQKITFHSLRHTFASWLALQGESLLTIRELLGHKSFEMTKRYAHLVPDEKRKATLRLEEAFEGKVNGNVLPMGDK